MKNDIEACRDLGYEKSNYSDFKKAIIKIQPSRRFGGIGVFALRDLKKGTIFGEVKYMDEDLFFTWDDFEKIDKESQKVIIDFCAESEYGFFAPRDINYISIPWHMNHCCDGNVGFNEEGDFITIEDVRGGEELCYDYGFGMSNPKYKLNCKCGADKCRGIVTGNDWKNSEYIKNNFEFISPEIRYLLSKE